MDKGEVQANQCFSLLTSFLFLFYIYYNYQPFLIPIYEPIFFYPRENVRPNTKGHYKSVFVSCFFPITNGTIINSLDVYKSRANFLFDYFSQQEELYIFTPEKGKEYLLLKNSNDYSPALKNKNLSYRQITPNIHFITTYQSVFDIPKIAKYKAKYESIANDMKQSYDSPISAEIGAIRNSKIVFLQEVIEKYEPKADMVFWIAIDLFNSAEYLIKKDKLLFPSSQRIEKIFSDGKVDNEKPKLVEKMIFSIFPICIRNYPRSLKDVNINKINTFIIAGFFGGPIEVVKQFLTEYWNYHDYLMKKNFYVLIEEKVMAAYCMLNRDKVFFINLRESQCNAYSSSIGFISHTNLCQFKNALHTLISSRSKTCTGGKSLNSWL